jgi:hypothetical protein
MFGLKRTALVSVSSFWQKFIGSHENVPLRADMNFYCTLMGPRVSLRAYNEHTPDSFRMITFKIKLF